MLKISQLNHWEEHSKHMGNMKLAPIRLPRNPPNLPFFPFHYILTLHEENTKKKINLKACSSKINYQCEEFLVKVAENVKQKHEIDNIVEFGWKKCDLAETDYLNVEVKGIQLTHNTFGSKPKPHATQMKTKTSALNLVPLDTTASIRMRSVYNYQAE